MIHAFFQKFSRIRLTINLALSANKNYNTDVSDCNYFKEFRIIISSISLSPVQMNKKFAKNCDCEKNEIEKHCCKADHKISWNQIVKRMNLRNTVVNQIGQEQYTCLGYRDILSPKNQTRKIGKIDTIVFICPKMFECSKQYTAYTH